MSSRTESSGSPRGEGAIAFAREADRAKRMREDLIMMIPLEETVSKRGNASVALLTEGRVVEYHRTSAHSVLNAWEWSWH